MIGSASGSGSGSSLGSGSGSSLGTGTGSGSGSGSGSLPGDGGSQLDAARTDGASGGDAARDSGFSPIEAGLAPDPTTCAAAATAHTYVGCDFWPTVTANIVASIFDFTAVVANVQSTMASVTVTGPGGFMTVVNIAPHTVQNVYLPWVQELKGPDVTATDQTFASSVSMRGGAYHLVSSLPVAVYQFSALEYQGAGGPPGKDWSSCPNLGGTGCFSFSNDASLLLPTTSMTGTYRVTGEHGSASLGGPILSITATANGTQVTVVLSSTASVVASGVADAAVGDGGVPIPTGAPGGTLNFSLNAGDVVELIGPATDTADFGGSLVTANKPIEVLTARQCANQPDPIAACDHLESSVFPAETLGRDYVVTVPTSPHATVVGHKVRFYGNVDGTTLTYSPSQPPGCPSTLNAGQVVECTGTPDCATGTDNSSTDGMDGDPVMVTCVAETFEVTGTHEFEVSSFMLGGSAVDPTDVTTAQEGDPSMSPMVPVEQFRSRYDFLAPVDYEENYADVVVAPGTTLTLDGAPVTATATVLNASWSIVRVPLASSIDGGISMASGAHILTGTKPFGLQVIGYGAYTSYQYPAGLDLALIATPPTP